MRSRSLPLQQRLGKMERYREARKSLKRVIKRVKRAHWKLLIEALEEDIWGVGYKIVVKEIKGFVPSVSMTPERLTAVLEELFPIRSETWETQVEPEMEPEAFTNEEMQVAVGDLKLRKAPGPDGAPAEILKMLWELTPQFISEVYNGLLRRKIFPVEWKTARLVLIPKSGKNPEDQGAYRPLSLIDVASKLYEALIRNRLSKELEERNLLSARQYGFRKGRSTIQAVVEVIEGSRRISEKWCVFVALDIKNAFNFVSWSSIIGSLRSMEVFPYLIQIISSYLQGRVLVTTSGERVLNAGVPQGSVLCPTLWNIVYDGVFRMQMPPGVSMVAYADDLGILIRAKTVNEVNFKIAMTLIDIEKWMEENKLKLAPQKTEAIVQGGQISMF